MGKATNLTSTKPPGYGAILRATNIPAAIALVVIIIAAGFAEHQSRRMHLKGLQGDVLNQVSLIRARLEGAINSNIQLTRGLVATLATEPDMHAGRFAMLADALVDGHSQIRHLAAAPDLVISMVHPMDGNAQAIGLDYTKNEAQRDSAIRARETREMVLAGPVDLVQGGKGFIGRFPVFVPDRRDGDRFWGIVSVVIDVDQIYRYSGLLDEELGIEVAISGRDGLGDEGVLFFGDERVLQDDPVTAQVILPSGSWQIAAIPKEGWDSDPENLWRLRLWIVLAALLIMIPTVVTGHLLEGRQRSFAEARNRERTLETLSRRLQLALDTSRVGVWELTLGEREEDWDSRMNEIFGYPADGGTRDFRHWADRVHPDDLERANREYEIAINSTDAYESQYRIVLDDGKIRHIRAIGTVYRVAGASPRVVGVALDISSDVRLTEDLREANWLMEARNAELETVRRRIEINALHDSLTGLPNRRYLDETLAEHAREFAAGNEQAAMLHIDLDRFKQINDTLGHAAGDAMLVHAARVLTSTVRDGDFVARVGGDEFVVVCRRPIESPDLGSSQLSKLAERIIARMQEPILFEGHECRCGVSIGIASDTDSIADPLRLLVNADIALYRAKGQGRNRYQFFNDALQGEIIRTKRIADEILTGVEKKQFVAWFQPQVDANTLEIVGVEALARWNHPVEGLLPPGAFLKIADELNVVGTIDRMIMEQAMAQMDKWEAEGIHVPKVSVNVSARRLNDEGLIEGLRKLHLQPGRLSFELVESIFLDEHDDIISWNVDRIKELGIEIEIDDFGTGHASIVSLLKLKPKRLKIDRQFILPIVRSAAQRQLVGSIVEIGKSLGIEVLAEGVETMEHARILRKLGCQSLQGYAFARPMAAEDFAEFYRGRRWRKAS